MNGRTLSTPAAIAVLSIIFFTWGALTCLNDVLIPHLKAVFAMNYAQTMLIQFTFFGTYFVMSIPSRIIANSLARNSTQRPPSFKRGSLKTPTSSRLYHS